MQVLPKGLPTAQQDKRMVPTAILYQPQPLRLWLQELMTLSLLVLESQDWRIRGRRIMSPPRSMQRKPKLV